MKRLQKLLEIEKKIKKLMELKKFNENETTTEPIIKPTTTPLTDPDEELCPDQWDEDMPGPKPKAFFIDNNKFTIDEFYKKIKISEQFKRMAYLTESIKDITTEMAMKIDDADYDSPHPSVKSGIEGQKDTAFTGLDFFKGKNTDYSTLEKMGSEEFNKIIKDIKPFGKMDNMEIYEAFNMMVSLETPHKEKLENLAIKKVGEQFGLPQSIIDKLEVKLVQGNISNPDDDDDNLFKSVDNDLEFTDEEKQIIKQNIEKRKIQNVLSMGAGFRAHSVFKDIKNDLDRIDDKLFPLYEKTMPNVSLFMWKTPFEDMMGMATIMGKSKLKKDQDGKIKGEAVAVIFPILLHETAKAAIELLFANYLRSLTKKYGKNVASEIIKKSDVFEDEIWMKRIGPTLWKYLHDIIDYVIKHDMESDYKIVSHLLNKISLMEPNEFVSFMNDVVYDGEKATDTIKKIAIDINNKISDYKNQKKEIPQPQDIESGKKLNISNIKDELKDIEKKAKEKDENTIQLDYNNMGINQLYKELDNAINDERYEDASKITTILKKFEK